MTHNTRREGLVAIGELSRRTGVPVRTIRFYCDAGLLRPHRSSGGHRLFDPIAVDRLRSIRRLRALGLGLNAITTVLEGTVSLTEAVAAEQAALDTELGEIMWRRATLAAARDAPATARTRRLDLLATISDRHDAHNNLVTFWRQLLAPAPASVFDAFVTMNVPAPPATPTPGQVVTYAELVGATADPALAPAISRQLWRSDLTGIRHPRELLAGIADACAMVDPLLTTRTPPRPGPELDCFLDAHTTARNERDTPGFRQRLLLGADDSDPRLHRYWELTGAITATTTAGAALRWLREALAQSRS
ncbi:MerR family transcriptional regulator [Nocardia sp. NPDC052254]|uniref:MerR family transcriptional regulator n=1 Tax=Nocardia sp. NPDC052254 TaxID=3155681 RepID=UPI00342FB782